jgi:hypothetical protein
MGPAGQDLGQDLGQGSIRRQQMIQAVRMNGNKKSELGTAGANLPATTLGALGLRYIVLICRAFSLKG